MRFKLLFCGVLLSGLVFVIGASALTFRDSEVDIYFNLNPTIGLEISDDELTIGGLVPGNSARSSNITLTVTSNSNYGYKLLASTGNGTTFINNKLVNGSASFDSIATNAATTLSSMAGGAWGYTKNNATTFSGLPYFSNGMVEISSKDSSGGETVAFAIGAKASNTQASGNYGNIINFALVANVSPPLLYNFVSSLSKGNFDLSTINDTLTTENSGVYKYVGEHSDNNNTYDIYFYRGIIDDTFTGTYGSTGNGDGGYPNYVKLTTYIGNTVSTTCWRIFRTTGSGGVKMIYNGTWGGTCSNASVSTGNPYHNRAEEYRSYSGNCNSYSIQYCGTDGYVTYVGYNYNPIYVTSDYISAIDNNILFNNDTPSNVRTYVENWYSERFGVAYNNLFESNAGYCNDRSTPGTNNGGTTTTTVPYNESSATVSFGAYTRLVNSASPSLACPNISGNDLLNGTNGKSYPVALITADELALAGNGYGGKEAHAQTDYLVSSSNYWTLSPARRLADGRVSIFVSWTGGISNHMVFVNDSVRPVVSLAPGTVITSGSGTAIDPWTVQ